ncbi:hypothetical protein ACFFOP_28740 [Sinosporangium siamense]|uniref:hypothetical protein n=1 Tax=Sinosporangium siamense TaxID=1367973 RepID=UPI0035ECC296
MRPEPSAINALISAGLGVGLSPDIARHAAGQIPTAWIAVEHPDCRRILTLLWGAGNHLSTAARLMRTTIIDWNWNNGFAQAKR